MSLLHFSDVAFSYPGQSEPLFREVTFDVNPGDRVALVGPNGAGKTTLLGLVAGELAPAAGGIVRRRGLTVAYGRQDVESEPSHAIYEFVLRSDDRIASLRDELATLEPSLDDPELAVRYAVRLAEYDEAGGFALEARADAVLDGLGIGADERRLSLAELSWGQRSRVQLARLLLTPADLLILDEPTNHLDVAALEWLEGFVARAEPAMILVSHDRRFLDRVSTSTLDLRRGRLTVYAGGFRAAREQRAVDERRAMEAYEASVRRRDAARRASEGRMRLAAKVARTPPGVRLGQDFYGAKAARVLRTARIMSERAVREEATVEKPWTEPAATRLEFANVAPAGDGAVVCEAISKAFDGRPALDGVDLRIGGGERVAILGPNGAGKSTLLRLIAGVERADAGAIRLGGRVRLGYLAQNADDLDPERSPAEICTGDGVDETWARTLLACLRIRGEAANRPVGTLSSGERTRVAVARLLVSASNVLLLDEPTNHLDVEGREGLEDALSQYPGAIVFVSHDRDFVDRLADRVVTL